MERYEAPIKDMNFVLTQLINFESYLKSVNNNEITTDSVKMIIEEASKFAAEELDSINHIGDQEGLKFENGIVRMPENFVKAYNLI